MKQSLVVLGAVTFVLFCQGCSKSSSSSASKTLPAITPPMKKAMPTAFKGSSRGIAQLEMINLNRFDFGREFGARTALPVANFTSRFFSAGPTNVLTILPAVDTTIASINTQISGASTAQACVTQTPVAYSFVAPDGKTVNMIGQCYETTNTNQFIEWGIDSSNVFYLMEGGTRANLVMSLAAIATPVSGSTTDYTVQVWFSVGNNNATAVASWDAGSYTVAEMVGNSATGKFEMTAAGIGIGFSGAQFISDGTQIYGIGSEDTGTTSSAQETVCVSASSLTTSVSSCTLDATSFQLTPIGRKLNNTTAVAQASWGASLYPTTPNVTLDGTATDATNFVLTTPTTGVGQFTAAH